MTIDQIKKKLKDAKNDTKKLCDRIIRILQLTTKNPIVAKKELMKMKKDLQIQKNVVESLEFDYAYMSEGLNEQIKDYEISFNRKFMDKMRGEGFNIKKMDDGYSIDDYFIKLNKKTDTFSIQYAEEVIRRGVPYEIDKVYRNFIDAKKDTENHFKKKQYQKVINILYETHQELSGETRNYQRKIGVNSIYRKFVYNLQSDAFKENPSRDNVTTYSRAYFSHDIMYYVRNKTKTSNGLSVRFGTATFDISGDRRKCLYLPDGRGSGKWIETIYFEKV